MQTCVLLAARRYDFTASDGKQVTGLTLTYLTGDTEDSTDSRGATPLQIAAPIDLYPMLGPLPGVYDMAFKQRVGAKGRPTLHCVGAKFIEPLDGLLGTISGA